MNRAQHQMMQIVQKIPVFDGLSLEQAQILIQISRFKKYAAGDTIYEVGEAGNEMLILIKGKLTVLSASGQPLGEALPGQSTGEMGVFTGHKRSATIVAAEDSAGLAITREALYNVMNNDRDIKGVILQNVVVELSNRLSESNTRLDVLSREVQEQTSSSDEDPPLEEPAEAADEEPADEELTDDEGEEVAEDGGEEGMPPAKETA